MSDWVKQNTGTTKSFYRYTYTDSLNIWAAGDSGIIAHTTNGGGNWTVQNSSTNFFIWDISFVNSRLGWAIANDLYDYTGSYVLITTNSGTNWSVHRYPDTTQFFLTMHFLDSLTGFMGGIYGSIVKTTNGGLNWDIVPRDTSAFASHSIFNVTFYNSSFAYAVGGRQDLAGVVLRTTDFGGSWLADGISPEPVLDMHFFDSLNALGSGGDNKYGSSIVRTSDGGETWDYRQLKMLGAGESVSFRTPAEGWISLSFTNNFALTLDSGNTWREISAPDSTFIREIDFIDSLRGWAVGVEGSIYKYYFQPVGITNQNQSIPDGFLFQNYPNPFNPNTTIRFSLEKPSYTKITLYDVMGREIRVLLNEVKKNGEHFINFDAAQLPSGVYYYKIVAGKFTETKKMMLVK